MSNLVKNIIIKLKNDSGPWGPYKGGKEEGRPDHKKPTNNQPNKEDDIEELLKRSQDFVRKIFNSDDKKNYRWHKKSPNSGDQNPKSLIGIVILGLVVLWLSFGIYKVDSDENALVLYFGKFHSVATPGLNYYIPKPFGQIIKKSVTAVNSEDFSYSLPRGKKNSLNKDLDSETLMLTGDENIVDIDFQVQWQISDIKDFVFNISDPNLTVRKAAESAMREVIARTPIVSALSDGKRQIEQDTKILSQEILDSYHSGVRVVLVQMRRVDPPKQVIDAFRDVQTAKADKEREINQALAYNNDILPKARGEAAKIIQAAEGYKQEVISRALGDTQRFLAIYSQYVARKDITKNRLYLDVMEDILKNSNKYIVGSEMLPHMAIGQKNDKR
jgi:membrane protease subunit HflK